jgi:hypothetical protein
VTSNNLKHFITQIDGDLYERRKSVLPNFTGEAYDMIYAKHILSYNIVIYQANRLNF